MNRRAGAGGSPPDEAAAAAAVERAAEAGDPEALWTVANWRLFGLYGPRDASAAHRLLKKAAERGHVEAHRIRATLIANGTGRPSDPERGRMLLEQIAAKDPYAALQVKFLEHVRPADAAAEAPRETLSSEPRVELVRGILSPEECRYLRILAEPRLQASFVIDPLSGRPVPHPVRTSAGTNFGPVEEDLVVHAINRRIAHATATNAECGEPLHMLRYLPGEEFKPHMDWIEGEENQRVLTVLVYLNDDYEGGETAFPQLGLTVRGRVGDALVFENAFADGRGDPRMEHAGLPVVRGMKWLATRWIRARPFDPLDPEASRV